MQIFRLYWCVQSAVIMAWKKIARDSSSFGWFAVFIVYTYNCHGGDRNWDFAISRGTQVWHANFLKIWPSMSHLWVLLNCTIMQILILQKFWKISAFAARLMCSTLPWIGNKPKRLTETCSWATGRALKTTSSRFRWLSQNDRTWFLSSRSISF